MRLSVFFLSLSLAITSLFTAGYVEAQISVNEPGATPGTFAVSRNGQATYSIPIWSPPDVVKLALSLDYSSSIQSGLMGAGWSLGGLSRIERCQRTVAQDGYAQPVL